MSEEKLRPAEVGDIGFIAELYETDVLPGHYLPLNVSPDMMFATAISQRGLPMSAGKLAVRVAIYTAGDERAGFAVYKQEPDFNLKHRQELWFFSLAEAFRGQGMGTRFLNAACAELSKSTREISARTLPASRRMAEMLSHRDFLHRGQDIGMSRDGSPVVFDKWLKRYR